MERDIDLLNTIDYLAKNLVCSFVESSPDVITDPNVWYLERKRKSL